MSTRSPASPEGRLHQRLIPLAWAAWAFVVALIALTSVGGVPEQTQGPSGIVVLCVYFLFLLSFGTVGALVASRRPDHPTGWLLCASAVAYSLPAVGQVPHRLVPFLSQGVKEWLGWGYPMGAGIAATFVLLLFPDGHLPSRRWRPVAWLAGGGLIAYVLGVSLAPGNLEGTHIANPFGIEGPPGAVFKVLRAGLAFALFAALASVASLVVRFRRGDSLVRAQLKWLVLVGALLVVAIGANVAISNVWGQGPVATDINNSLVTGALACAPVAIGIAITRYHLYDIDRIISRTLSYVSVTVVLGGLYALVVVLPTAVVGSRRTPGAVVAAATLVVAALFRPLRRSVQELVDRRFNRARYNAARTIEAFSLRLREEIDIDALRRELTRVVAAAMEPTHAELWLRPQAKGVPASAVAPPAT